VIQLRKKPYPDTIRTLLFEDLIHNPEQAPRDILDFCGLPWEDNLREEILSATTDRGSLTAAGKTIQVADRHNEHLPRFLKPLASSPIY
jgi:hypothetical protein